MYVLIMLHEGFLVAKTTEGLFWSCYRQEHAKLITTKTPGYQAIITAQTAASQ